MNADLKADVEPINVSEMESIARSRLPQIAFDYYCSGANDEITLRENRAAFERLFLHPKMLVDVSKRDLRTTVLGQQLSMPVITAPTAFQCMAHPEGEVATARAAKHAGTIMTLSTLSTSSVEDVSAAAHGSVWFQLYVYKDRGITQALVERAAAADCKALVLTVDAPLLGRRERDVRNRFQLPPGMSVANLRRDGLCNLPAEVDDSGLAAYIASLIDPSLTWRDVEWLQSLSKMPVLVKGILRADDAVRAKEHGCAGIVVSNHGGRQLDGVPATITVLPEIAEAVGSDIEILLDGGIRRGTDIVKALALGARAVLVGRPVLWALACGGEAGVTMMLEMLRAELDLAMALCGVSSIEDLCPDLIYGARK